MRKVILDLAVTLDGFIEGPNGEVDWCIMDEEMDFPAFLSSIDTIFYGRVSYDSWGNFQPGEDATETDKRLWEAIHSKKKYVFSTANRSDRNATFINTDILPQIQRIKTEGDSTEQKDIWLYGGAGLVSYFMAQDLIDVYRLSVHPVLLGSGKPLFEQIGRPVSLSLAESRTFKSGVVQLVYHKKKSS